MNTFPQCLFSTNKCCQLWNKILATSSFAACCVHTAYTHNVVTQAGNFPFSLLHRNEKGGRRDPIKTSSATQKRVATHRLRNTVLNAMVYVYGRLYCKNSLVATGLLSSPSEPSTCLTFTESLLSSPARIRGKSLAESPPVYRAVVPFNATFSHLVVISGWHRTSSETVVFIMGLLTI